MSRDDVIFWCDWWRELCLKFGTSVYTANETAALLARDLEREAGADETQVSQSVS